MSDGNVTVKSNGRSVTVKAPQMGIGAIADLMNDKGVWFVNAAMVEAYRRKTYAVMAKEPDDAKVQAIMEAWLPWHDMPTPPEEIEREKAKKRLAPLAAKVAALTPEEQRLLVKMAKQVSTEPQEPAQPTHSGSSASPG